MALEFRRLKASICAPECHFLLCASTTMYRIAFLKQKAGDLKDQELYRMNAPEFRFSIDSDNSSASGMGTSSDQQSGSKADGSHSKVQMQKSMSSTDEEDSEYSRQIHQEVGRLSLEDRKILQETFKKMEHRPIRCGLNVMLGLFSEYPQYKNIWPQFQQIPDSSLMSAPELTKHAAVYMRGLRTIIDNMSDDDHMCRALRKIARAHVKWNIYKKHIIHMLAPLLDQVRAHAGMTPEIEKAWTTLFDVIANLIDVFRASESANVRSAVLKSRK